MGGLVIGAPPPGKNHTIEAPLLYCPSCCQAAHICPRWLRRDVGWTDSLAISVAITLWILRCAQNDSPLSWLFTCQSCIGSSLSPLVGRVRR